MEESLAIAFCNSWPFVHREFFTSFIKLTSTEQIARLADLGIGVYKVIPEVAFPIDLCRNVIVKRVIEDGIDWLVFLDTDMMHPPDTVPRLVETAKKLDVKVVSGLYFQKGPPHLPVMLKSS